MKHLILPIQAGILLLSLVAASTSVPDLLGTPPEEGEEATGGEESQESSQDPAPARKPVLPTFHNTRFEEDWSVLSTVDRSGYEKFKFVPLNDSGAAFLSFGGQLRLRGEGWKNFGFVGSKDRDDSFGLLRLRLHADLWLGSRFRVFAEGKSSLSTNRNLPGGTRTLDVDTIDLQNALVDIKATLEPVALLFRLGRQELQFGKQRLVSPLDWSNTRRTWDAARAIVQTGSWRVDGFWSKYAPVKKYSFNSSSDSGVDFYGIYGAGRLGESKMELDLYWLGIQKDSATFGGVSGQEDRQSIGARFAGNFGSADFDLEGTYQFGDHAKRDIRANMFASQVGYRFQQAKTMPHLYVGFDYASGDGDPSDNKVGTFNQLFPLGHAYLGFIDLIGRQNIMDLNEGVALSPFKKTGFAFSGHAFWRANTKDAVYNPGGGVEFPGDASDKRYIGFGIDLTANHKIGRHYVVSGGYSFMLPGSLVKDTGPAENIHLVHIAFQTTF
jgi:hypothetical protein